MLQNKLLKNNIRIQMVYSWFKHNKYCQIVAFVFFVLDCQTASKYQNPDLSR